MKRRISFFIFAFLFVAGIAATSSASVNRFFNHLLRNGNGGAAPPADPTLTAWAQWESGSDLLATDGLMPVYGTKGVESATNTPGSRANQVSWSDSSGNLWLYGGYDVNNKSRADLWKLNISNDRWTWVAGSSATTGINAVYGTKGVSSPANTPGTRGGAFSWVDSSGKLWMFGGSVSIYTSDIWMFDPTTSEWTWVAGLSGSANPGVYGTLGVASTSNYPGGRADSVGWYDSTNNELWIFGGSGIDSVASSYGNLSDLWKFKVSTGEWTWVGGPNVKNQNGVYGTQGTPSTSNIPGSRSKALGWTDSSGNLYLMSGSGAYATGTSNAALVDFWKFNPVTLEWTWLNGSSSSFVPAIYGTKGVSSPTTYPGYRGGATYWKDISGNFWLLGGGSGYNDLFKYNPTTSEWTWMSGSGGTSYGLAAYGTVGVPSTSNYPSGRSGVAAGTIDGSSNIRIYGGGGANPNANNGPLDEYWKFDPAASTWTFISGTTGLIPHASYGSKGVTSTSNFPGGRKDSAFWTDTSGNIWMFGGYGYASGNGYTNYLNDLWKYDPHKQAWTWVGGNNTSTPVYGVYGTKGVAGATNFPGARMAAVSWVDSSGDLWLFGGYGYATSTTGYLSDLWKYSISTGQWTWVEGSSAPGAFGTYGTRLSPSTSNYPGGRYYSTGRTDSSGNVWIFGGYGLGASGGSGHLNDLWKYNPSNGEWTWYSGGSTINQYGAYGTQNVASTSNFPGTRYTHQMLVNSSGKILIFGGNGYATSPSIGPLNDLWIYNPTTDEWTWLSGLTVASQAGVYGTKGVGSTANYPSTRYGMSAWMDSGGDLWTANGVGYASPTYLHLNDIWKFSFSTAKWTWVGGSSSGTSAGTFGTKGISSPSNEISARYEHNFQADALGNLWTFGGIGIDSKGNAGSMRDLWRTNITSSDLATQISWFAPTLFKINKCVYAEVRRKNATYFATDASALAVTLGGNGAGSFYSDSGCLSSTSSVSIASGNYTKGFYFKSPSAASLTWTADAGSFTQATAAVTVLGATAPVSSLSTIASSASSVLADGTTTTTVTITLADADGDPVSGVSGVTFAATGTGNTLVQPVGSTNSSGIVTGTLKSTIPESKTLSITSPAALTNTTSVTFTPSQLTISGSATPMSTVCNAYTITSTGSTGTAGNMASATTVTLSGGGSGSFYTTSGCGTTTSTATIAANSSSTTVYYKNASSQSLTLTAAAAGLTSGTLNVLTYVMCQKILTSADGTSWTIPSDWNATTNTIEVIAGGGGGATSASGTAGASGGGGGGYSKITNVTTFPASGNTVTMGIAAAVGAGTAGQATYLCRTLGGCTYNSGTVVVSAAGGSAGAAAGTPTGGAAVTGTGFTGGSGAAQSGGKGGGGGGAAGLSGAGGSASGQTGGTGDNGSGGTTGAAGTEWTTAGSGGGGAGGNASAAGGAGGNYGAGGGATGKSPGANVGGNGARGVIVISYGGTTCS